MATAPASATDRPAPRPTDLPRVVLLAAGHLTNDMFGNLATSLAPYFVIAGKLSAPAAGALVLVYLAGSSVLQPLFGIVSDRSGRRLFAVAAPSCIAVALLLMAVAPSAWLIFVLAILGGVATAGFHPQGASMVNRVAGDARGWAMSLFSMGGNVGYGIGPLLATLIVAIDGPACLLLALPAFVCSIALFRFAPSVKSESMHSAAHSLRDARANVGPLLLIVLVIAIRSGAMSGVIFLAPLWFHAQGLPARLGSYGSSIFLLTGALGGLYAGRLSDRIGRRPVVVWSLLAAAPLILLVGVLPGLAAWPALAVAGMAILASNSVTVVQAQEMLPGNVGLAAGLTLGLGFGLSGVITFIISAAVKIAAPQHTIWLTATLPLVAAAIALLVPAGRHAPALPAAEFELI